MMKRLIIGLGVSGACFFSYVQKMHAQSPWHEQGCIVFNPPEGRAPTAHRKDATMESREELLARLFPHTYRYDGGRFQVHASFSEARAREVYYESEDIKAQFFRFLGSREAPPYSRPMNDDTVHIRVYATKQDLYTYQKPLFGHLAPSTGFYSADIGTAFAHDGKEQWEEGGRMRATIRHEYVHHLQFKYLYNRLSARSVWHVEGGAEFFTGATRTKDIRLLGVGSNFAFRPPYNLTLRDVIYAGYASRAAVPYHEGALLVAYLYYHERDILHELLALAREPESSAHDDFLQRLIEDKPMERAYQRYAAYAYKERDNRLIPGISRMEDLFLQESNPAAIVEAFEQEGMRPLSHTLTSTSPAALNKRMRVHITWQGDALETESPGQALRAFNPVLNDKLIALAENHPHLSNFRASTAYCTNITFTVQGDGTYIPSADCYFEVPLRPDHVEYVEPTLVVTPESKAVDNGSGRFEISVRTNSTDWSVSESHEWTSLSDDRGRTDREVLLGSEGGRIRLHYQPSSSPSRRAMISIKSTGGLTRFIQLTQQNPIAKPTLTVRADALPQGATLRTLPHAAGSFRVQVSSNTTWQVSDGAADWIHLVSPYDGLSPVTGGVDRGVVQVSYAAHTAKNPREATITFSASGLDEAPTLMLRQKEWAAPSVQWYPNPARDEVVITGHEGTMLRVLDMGGQVVSSHALTPGQDFVLNLLGYREGLYLLDIRGPNARVLRRLVLR